MLRQRIGGTGSILTTFVHIIDVEFSWIRGMQGKPDLQVKLEDFQTLQQVRELSEQRLDEVQAYLSTWSYEWEKQVVVVPWTEGRYTQGEILRHLIAHEIHHIGQLSVWARELGLKPVSANVIGRGLS